MTNIANPCYDLTANEMAQESEREGRILPGSVWRIESPYLEGEPVLLAEFTGDEYVLVTAHRSGSEEVPELYIPTSASRLAYGVMAAGGCAGREQDTFYAGETLVLRTTHFISGAPGSFRALNDRNFWDVLAGALIVCGLAREAAMMDTLIANAVMRAAAPFSATNEMGDNPDVMRGEITG